MKLIDLLSEMKEEETRQEFNLYESLKDEEIKDEEAFERAKRLKTKFKEEIKVCSSVLYNYLLENDIKGAISFISKTLMKYYYFELMDAFGVDGMLNSAFKLNLTPAMKKKFEKFILELEKLKKKMNY